jgi:hypothetical protein
MPHRPASIPLGNLPIKKTYHSGFSRRLRLLANVGYLGIEIATFFHMGEFVAGTLFATAHA